MTLRSLTPLALLVLAPTCWAQPFLPDLVRQAVEASPTVAAGRHRVQQARGAASADASPSNPTIEFSPGIGFTNSNFALGQTFDLSGRRAARARRSEAEIQLAVAGLLKAQTAVALEFLAAFAELLASRELASFADSGVEGATSTMEAIRHRVSIGEAPSVHQTRAEIELARAEQGQVLARQRAQAATMRVLSSFGQDTFSEPVWFLPVPLAGSVVRAERVEADAHVEVARAGVLEASRLGRPNLFAGIAADVWSLDRRPLQDGNVGLQLQLSMPLWDQGEHRHSRAAAQADVRAREAELLEVERHLRLELDTASLEVDAARQVAKAYEGGVVPKAQQMVAAMRAGVAAGLTSFVEVLEAQRALNELQREAAEATLALRLAEARHLAAAGRLPGVGDSK